MKKIITIFCFLIITFSMFSTAFAQINNKQKVCAEYVGTGRKYYVNANILTGQDLNQKTNSEKFDSMGNYIVIFWGPENVSIIKENNCYLSSDCEGIDQKGYRWKVNKNSFLTETSCEDSDPLSTLQ